MKKVLLLLVLVLGCGVVFGYDAISGVPVAIRSGGYELVLVKAGRGYVVSFNGDGKVYDTYGKGKPLMVIVDGDEYYGVYNRYDRIGSDLICYGEVLSDNGSRFEVRDVYSVKRSSGFKLARELEVVKAGGGDKVFNSIYGVAITRDGELLANEYFMPGVWYRTNFEMQMAGVLAADASDKYFVVREDRLPLPMVTARVKADGRVFTLSHLQSKPETYGGDRGVGPIVDERLRTGALGVTCEDDLNIVFVYPGSEGEKNHLGRGKERYGWANRHHPVREGLEQKYQLGISFGVSGSYAEAVSSSWREVFDDYSPEVEQVNQAAAYSGLIDTLEEYYMAADKEGEGYDAPGFPFSVYVPSGDVRAYNYQMGFIGRQIPNAYYLIYAGLSGGDKGKVEKGEAIIDFWAKESLSEDGMPRTWYDPAKGEGEVGSWRKGDNRSGGSAMRVMATGMEGMLNGWEVMKDAGDDKKEWLDACRKFGDWLVSSQNGDGSYYLAYETKLTNGEHRPSNMSKYTTSNPICFLVGLYKATEDKRYLAAAMRAGEFCWREIHEKYCYIGSVIDNPNVIDRESGQEALRAFLCLCQISGDRRWLAAAKQAGDYTSTWMYSYNVPGEYGNKDTIFPANVTVVGQMLIATGHSGADMGGAFSSYEYYKLYKLTGDRYYKLVSDILSNNTKLTMNWDGKLYPGKARGLQLEAFNVTVPRRKGVAECLSWNYAAHLEPMVCKFRSGESAKVKK